MRNFSRFSSTHESGDKRKRAKPGGLEASGSLLEGAAGGGGGVLVLYRRGGVAHHVVVVGRRAVALQAGVQRRVVQAEVQRGDGRRELVLL